MWVEMIRLLQPPANTYVHGLQASDTGTACYQSLIHQQKQYFD